MDRFLEIVSTVPKWVYFLLVVVVVGGGIYWYSSGNGLRNVERFTVERGDLLEEVNVTGQVKAVQEVDLGFELTGKVAKVLVDVGDRVEEGQELVVLENGDLYAQLLKAQAGRQSAQAEYQALKAELANARAEVGSSQAAVENEEAKLQQFVAALDEAQEQLKELKRGTRVEEITVAENAVENASNEIADLEVDLENAKGSAEQALAALLEEAKDVMKEAAVTSRKLLSDNLADVVYPISFPSNETCEAQVVTIYNYDTTLCGAAMRAVTEMEDLAETTASSPVGQAEITSRLTLFTADLKAVRLLFDQALAVANGAISDDEDFSASVSITDAELAALKVPVTSGQIELEGIIQEVTSIGQRITTQVVQNQADIALAENKLNRARDGLSVAEVDLDLKLAGSTPEAIAAQEAKVRQALANLAAQEAAIKQAQLAPSAQQSKIDLAQARLNSQGAAIKQAEAEVNDTEARINKTIIKAPFAGIVTFQEADVGEIIGANVVILTLISDDAFEIEANIPEIDISKVKIGDEALITLDAYGINQFFTAHVKAIDPAETIVDEVPNYQVTFQFDEQDERVRSGMTANISLATNEWLDVLYVPEYALRRADDGVFVSLFTLDEQGKGQTEQVPVEIGELSTDGFRIIRSGLGEGDVIAITFE